MNTIGKTHPDIESMRAVTISREYGSGGGEVAARLASRLGWRLLDHEAVVQVAQQLGISVAEAEEQDEHRESLGMRLLNSLSMIQPPMSNAVPALSIADSQAYDTAMRQVVKTALSSGHVVIVGRGSQMLLKGQRDILHVRIVAPFEQRVAYVERREGLEREHAQSRVHYKDSGRMRYLRAQYGLDPGDPLLYDLVLNTAILSLDSTVQLIISALTYKAGQIAIPLAQLGPGTGLPRYPGHSQDFNMPDEKG